MTTQPFVDFSGLLVLERRIAELRSRLLSPHVALPVRIDQLRELHAVIRTRDSMYATLR